MKTLYLLNRKVRLAFGSAIFALLVVGAISYRGIIVSRASDRWVRHTHEVLESVQDLCLAWESISSSSRGFVLTGDESYVAAYRGAGLKAEQDQEVIRRLTADNPEQQRQLPILAALITEKIQRAELVTGLRRSQNLAVASAAMQSGADEQMAAEFSGVASRLQDEELRLLVLRDADTSRRLRQTKTNLSLGVLLGLLIACTAGWSVQRDSSALGLAEAALRESEEKYRTLLDGIQDYAIFMLDPRGQVVSWSAGAQRIKGYSAEQIIGQNFSCFFPQEDIEQGRPEEILRLAAANGRHEVQCMRVRKDGSQFPSDVIFTALRGPTGDLLGFSEIGRDLTESQESAARLLQNAGELNRSNQALVKSARAARTMAQQIAHSAEHDALTGLPNRLLLNDRLGQAIALAKRHVCQVAVLFLDVDGFKHINDSLGHSIGDKLLQSIANRLVDCVHAPDTVSRHGGDKFVVLLPEVGQPEDAGHTARRLLQALAEAHSVDGHDLHVSTSIGVSVYPGDGLDVETLVKNADTAMYKAKENGHHSVQFFRPAMNVQAVERQSIEEYLRRAVERKEFTLHYQPKIDLGTGAITGAEALIRWTHPTRGSLLPEQFIPVAEDCGLIVPIGVWALREACAQTRSWADAGLPAITMAVNVAAMQFRNPSFLEDVFSVLNETGVDPRYLELELTESALMTRAELTSSILATLRAKGVRVAVDDFGIGYSSLSYLRKFPLDALKIDQTFVRQITTIPDETTIVRAIISMGRSLNLRVIAEGVETQDQLDFLNAYGCDEAQGYYFSRAIPAEQFGKLLGCQGLSKLVHSAMGMTASAPLFQSENSMPRWPI